MLTTEILRSILGRADDCDGAVFGYVDLRRWGRQAIEQLVRLGLLREIERAQVVECDGCMQGCFVTPEIEIDPRTGKLRGYYLCRDEFYGGPQIFDEDHFRQWSLCFEGLANLVAGSLGFEDVQAVVPRRLCLLGTLPTGGGPLDVFLASGLRAKDSGPAVVQAPRLRASPAPAVVALHNLPEPSFWRGIRPAATLALSEHILWDAQTCRLDLGSLENVLNSLRPPVPEEQWLTVTQCAQLLTKDLLGISLDQARAKVSWAAGAGKFVTNGQKGRARRIERVSFDAWRLEQRDRSLDAHDEQRL